MAPSVMLLGTCRWPLFADGALCDCALCDASQHLKLALVLLVADHPHTAHDINQGAKFARGTLAYL